MSFVCTKKVKLGDKEFVPGDAIPDELFVGGRASKLLSYGYIAEVNPDGSPALTGGDTEPVGFITLTLSGEEVALSAESVQTIVDTMQKNVDDAKAAIEDEVDESVLTFLSVCESRKGVKEVALKQLAVISSLKGDGMGSKE